MLVSPLRIHCDKVLLHMATYYTSTYIHNPPVTRYPCLTCGECTARLCTKMPATSPCDELWSLSSSAASAGGRKRPKTGRGTSTRSVVGSKRRTMACSPNGMVSTRSSPDRSLSARMSKKLWVSKSAEAGPVEGEEGEDEKLADMRHSERPTNLEGSNKQISAQSPTWLIPQLLQNASKHCSVSYRSGADEKRMPNKSTKQIWSLNRKQTGFGWIEVLKYSWLPIAFWKQGFKAFKPGNRNLPLSVPDHRSKNSPRAHRSPGVAP